MIKQFKQLDENDLTMNEDATLTNALVRDMSVNTGRKLGLTLSGLALLLMTSTASGIFDFVRCG